MHTLLLQAVDLGVEDRLLFSIARQPRSWTAFKTALIELIEEAEAEQSEEAQEPAWQEPD